MMKTGFIRAIAAIGLLTSGLAAPAWAEDAPPAVSAPNMKVDVSAGTLAGGAAVMTGFTGTAPLGHSLGVQLDAALGNADQDMRGGFAGHLFYRDPRSFLLGATAMWSSVAGPHLGSRSDIRRAGLEAEVYLGDFSVLPSFGAQNANGDTTGYASLAGIYYPTPYLALATSVGGTGNHRTLQVGFEYQLFEDTPLSLIGDSGIDNKSTPFFLAGIRYSFGAPSKTIKDRDRFDDPGNIVRTMNTSGASSVTTTNGHTPKPSAAAEAPPT
ncbi:hypothetical protein A6A05_11930 [Magnetospirillum moscoviense]|uniref:Outer membrane protein beta-barrel domain-containing protein n=2 Tax=Magnetospirillum moscoviense TaxID=1437059 RepID=A0A178MPR7_9PROT|nr:hypothetical protein A6A05_11930 [Magnetospirillum moscoviense]